MIPKHRKKTMMKLQKRHLIAKYFLFPVLCLLFSSSILLAEKGSLSFQPLEIQNGSDRLGDSSLALQAIIFQKGSAVALIGGRVVREGDLVDGARILDMTSQQVTLERGEDTFRLVFHG
ncbi:MAG: hypothetical protein Q7S00_07785, partial [bacterium]|nr:hypothetical protein [bacterium]